MRPQRIEVGELRVSLHGVAPALARAAAEGLEQEIRRRLSALPPDVGLPANVPTLGVDSIRHVGALDAGTLRALIAERLIAGLTVTGG